MLASKTRLPSNVKFVEENLNCFNKPVPQGVSGCWVILIGGGAPGGVCPYGGGGAQGGVGGGGGARVGWVFIPRKLLGTTYSTTVGIGGGKDGVSANYNGYGTASVFSSGTITLTAGGAVSYVGGTASAVGINAPMVNGCNGASSSCASGTSGFTTNSPAGGGAGGLANANDAGNNGGSGGSSGSVGGVGGIYNGTAARSTPLDAPMGFAGGGGGGGGGGWFAAGGPGSNGAKYGGGGGGGGGISGGVNPACSLGGDGCTAVIWVVDESPLEPPQATAMGFTAPPFGTLIPSWLDITAWQQIPSVNGYMPDVVNGEYLRMPMSMLVTISAWVTWAGAAGTGAKGDYGPYNQLAIIDGVGTEMAIGALVYGGSGTITATYTGAVSEGQLITAKPKEWNVAGYGYYTGGNVTVTPSVWL